MKKKAFLSKKKNYPGHSIKLFLASLTSIGTTAFADTPFGLIGGQNGEAGAYTAFFSNTSVSTPISGLPADGRINAVSLNTTGIGLIGGVNGVDAYAAFVKENQIITSFSFGFPNGAFTSASINEAGLGLVGGSSVVFSPFVAYLSQDGVVTSLALPSVDSIESTDLNGSGVGLLGGEGAALAYAAYSAPDGTVTPISTPSTDIGHIYTVSINNEGKGVIAGRLGSNMYAALTNPDGTAASISTISSVVGTLYSSAINASGTSLVGGADNSGNAYMAYVLPDGTATPLFDTPFSGTINHIALNDSGTGLVAGDNTGFVYVALVNPDGSLQSLFDSSTNGSINGVALNKEGVGLIGGDISGAYLALVAPNGALTQISLSDVSVLQDVAILSRGSTPNPSPIPIINKVVPQSTGPYASAIYTQLTANAALNTHLIQKNKLWLRKHPLESSSTRLGKSSESLVPASLLAHNSDELLAFNPETQSAPKEKEIFSKKNSIWLEPFGSFVHLKEHRAIPHYTNDIAGILLGYDRQGSNYIVGATLGYGFNYIQYSNSLGHGKINEEMLSIYGSYYMDHLWMEGAIWGGLYQFRNTRHTLLSITSKGHTHGWLLTPHLQMASPWKIGHLENYHIEPFFSLDWINNWQNSYTESGPAGFNLKMPHVYDSLLQSEAGLRFYERFAYHWGDFCLEEKLSYVNQAPFHFKSATTSFVSSSATFPIAVGSSKIQNLGAFQILGAFAPAHSSFYGGFSFQVTAGSAYQNYFGSLFWGADF